MTKDVRISIRGMQTIEGDASDPVRIAVSGTYYYKNGCHYVFYEEEQEGFEGVTKNRVRIRADAMDIRKEGILNTHMVFERGKTNPMHYDTPFGCFLFEIDTKSFSLLETEDEISLKVVYTLQTNTQLLSGCRAEMRITPEEIKE